MSNQIPLWAGAIIGTVLIFYFINRYVRSHPLSRKEEKTLEEIAKDD
jgi:hypothetical protein